MTTKTNAEQCQAILEEYLGEPLFKPPLSVDDFIPDEYKRPRPLPRLLRKCFVWIDYLAFVVGAIGLILFVIPVGLMWLGIKI